MTSYKLVLSVDLEEWYHSRRWVDGGQARAMPDTRALIRQLYDDEKPAGEVIAPTQAVLDLFDRYQSKCTFFVLGEMAEWYPALVREIAERGHEIACHGMHHVDMGVLGSESFAEQLKEATALLERTSGQRPVGYRAPNLVYEPWATRILEEQGFLYDSTVCVSRSIGGKYRGWAGAPRYPYRPSYSAIGERGDAQLVELPLPSFPVVRLSAGSGIMTRVIGYHWTAVALAHVIRKGHTSFYFHPWEVGRRPRPTGHFIRNAIFLRRTGPWMLSAIEKILKRFEGRTMTARECAADAT